MGEKFRAPAEKISTVKIKSNLLDLHELFLLKMTQLKIKCISFYYIYYPNVVHDFMIITMIFYYFCFRLFFMNVL